MSIWVYVHVIIGKNPKVITPMWVGMGHVWKNYTEFICLLCLTCQPVRRNERMCACVYAWLHRAV